MYATLHYPLPRKLLYVLLLWYILEIGSTACYLPNQVGCLYTLICNIKDILCLFLFAIYSAQRMEFFV